MLEQIPNLLAEPLVSKLTYLTVGLVIIFFVNNLLRRFSGRIAGNSSVKFQLRKTFTFIAYAAAVLFTMAVFQVNLSGLNVALGVASAGIAFALQEVIASIAGYLAIHFAGFYKIGDRVELGGIKGDVIEISVLRTTIMEMGGWVKGDLYNGKMVRVANSFIFKEPVYNYSGDFPFLWDEMTIPVKTNSDHQLIRKIIMDILQEEVGAYAQEVAKSWEHMTDKYQIEKARLEPFVAMSFDENWITFTLRYVVDFKSRRGTKDKLFSKILDAITQSKGKIEVASAAYEITAFPKVNVQSQN